MSRLELPLLDGWETVTDAASYLSVSRQAIHKMLEDGLFPSARQLGRSTSKPIYIVSSEELENVYKSRKARSAVEAKGGSDS